MTDAALAFDTDFALDPAPTGNALTTIAPPSPSESAATPAAPSVDLTFAEKAAIVIVALGPDSASSVLGELGPQRIRTFARALNDMPEVPAETVDAVLAEFLDLLEETKTISGGKEETRRFLSSVLAVDEVAQVMNDVEANRRSVWSSLSEVEDERIAGWLATEHPQVAAIALTKLTSAKAAKILERLEKPTAQEIVLRMGAATEADAAIAARIGEVIEREFLPEAKHEQSKKSPAKLIAAVMNHVETDTRDLLLGHMGQESPALAKEIEKVMFTFDHITERVNPRDVSAIVKAMNETSLLKALKSGGESAERTAEFIFENISKRLAERLREDLAALEEPKKKEIEQARAELVSVITDLKDRGDIKLLIEEEE
ncbi:MAG: FliG C-terminal domain-containing protein [Pseudomonadota bacterium]